MSELLKAMLAVKVALAKHGGITKDKKAPDQIGGYAFRGIDDADNVLCQLTSEHGLMAFPRVLQQICETQEIPAYGNKPAKLQHHVRCELEVLWLHISGTGTERSGLRTVTWGEGIDSGDKGTGKAFSNARKQAMFSVFMIPTHGENIEEHATEVGPAVTKPSVKKAKAESVTATPSPTTNEVIKSVYGVKTFPVLQTFYETHGGDRDIVKAIINQACGLFDTADSMATVREGLALYKAMGEPDDLTQHGNEAYARMRQ